mmetsp:Transcript_8882/g.21649  ORF Transcript_8882/g.21649 Transcript_8882/m.21649 type:complete len:284 (+) Transcript_8882:3232-4083(+)
MTGETHFFFFVFFLPVRFRFGVERVRKPVAVAPLFAPVPVVPPFAMPGGAAPPEADPKPVPFIMLFAISTPAPAMSAAEGAPAPAAGATVFVLPAPAAPRTDALGAADGKRLSVWLLSVGAGTTGWRVVAEDEELCEAPATDCQLLPCSGMPPTDCTESEAASQVAAAAFPLAKAAVADDAALLLESEFGRGAAGCGLLLEPETRTGPLAPQAPDPAILPAGAAPAVAPPACCCIAFSATASAFAMSVPSSPLVVVSPGPAAAPVPANARSGIDWAFCEFLEM